MAGKKLNEEASGNSSRAVVDDEEIGQLGISGSQLIENINDAILVINPKDYTVVMTNRSLLEELKMKREEVIGKTCYEVTHHRSTPCSPPDDICPIERMMKTESVAVEHTHYDREGNKFYVEVYVHSIKDNEGNIIGILHIARDITEHKKMEEKLRESEEKYRAIFDNVTDVITYVDTHGKILDANRRVEDVLGYKRNEIVGKNFVKLIRLIGLRNISRMLRLFVSTTQKGEAEKIIELELKHRNGNKVTMEVGTNFIKKNGKVEGVVNIFRDITERKKTEDALKESEEKFKNLVETTSDWIWQVDKNGVFTYSSPKIKDVLGYEPEEVLGKTPFNLMPEDEAKSVAKSFGEIVEKKKPFHGLENWNIHKNGTKVLLETSGVPILNEKGDFEGYRGIDRDITERKQMEEELQMREQRFRTIFESAMEGILLADPETNKFTLGNKRICKMLGYSQEELKDIGIMDIHPKEDLAHVLEDFEKQRNGEIVLSTALPVLRKDGTVFNADISSAQIMIAGKTYPMGFFRDVTERKNMEDRLKESGKKLKVLNEKLRVISRLSRHDVRNKLSAIKGNTYLMRKKLPENSEALDYVKRIEESVEQTVRLFDYAAAYEKLGAEELTYVDVGKAVDEAVSLLSGLEIRVLNDCHGLTVMADSLLRQLFYNLVDNSLKHGEKVREIRVHFKDEKDGLKLFYEDDGVGIPQDNKPKLFNEGFTTGGGSGFGLFLVKRMVEVYGWTIQETGEHGKGAQFTITMPRLSKEGKENYQLS